LLEKLEQGGCELSKLFLIHEPKFLVKRLSGKSDQSFGQASNADH
jgi:hypothetical protein